MLALLFLLVGADAPDPITLAELKKLAAEITGPISANDTTEAQREAIFAERKAKLPIGRQIKFKAAFFDAERNDAGWDVYVVYESPRRITLTQPNMFDGARLVTTSEVVPVERILAKVPTADRNIATLPRGKPVEVSGVISAAKIEGAPRPQWYRAKFDLESATITPLKKRR